MEKLVDLQHSSTLFSLSFLAEVQTIIFEYALAEYYRAEDKKQKTGNVDCVPRCVNCWFLPNEEDFKSQQWSNHDNH
jgi:hypothetical protein